MWKLLVGALLSLILLAGGLGFYLSDKIYLRGEHRPIPLAELDRTFTADELRHDIAHLVAMFDKVHPDFAGIGGARFRSAAADLAAGIGTPMDRMAFYRKLAPLNRFLRDGHTRLRIPADDLAHYEKSGGRYLPLTVAYREGGLVIVRVLQDNGDLRPDDRLVAINGVEAGRLANFSLSSQSGESPALRQAYAEALFHRTVWAAGIEAPFTVEAERDGRRLTVKFAGLSRTDYAARRESGAGRRNSFRVLNANTGLLVFNHMPSGLSGLRRFFETMFGTIESRGLGRLIIDLRDNRGGDSRAGDLLMRYLTKRELPSFERVDVKVTEEIKAYYRTLLPPGFQWLPLHWFVPVLARIQATPPGASFTMHPGPAEPRRRKDRPEHGFDGELYVLIGPKTYSSAAIFAAPLKHFGRAIFVGQETGEPLIFFGENYYFDLPNSRLQGVVSHKKFVLVGAVDSRTGIKPDIEVPLADALRAAEQHR